MMVAPFNLEHALPDVRMPGHSTVLGLSEANQTRFDWEKREGRPKGRTKCPCSNSPSPRKGNSIPEWLISTPLNGVQVAQR